VVSFAPRWPPAFRRRQRLGIAPFVDFRESCREQIELLLPVLGVAIQPDGRIEQRAHIEAAAADASTALLLHHSGPHQNLDMARHALQRDVEGRREFGLEQRLTVEPLQDPAADGIAKRTEHPVEPRIVSDLCPETLNPFWNPVELVGIQMKIRLSPSGSVVGPDLCAFDLTGRTIDLACVTQGDLFHEFIE
jgi:hypothetical protein